MANSLHTLIRDLHRARGRERRGLALAEGVRLVEEALASAIPLRGVVVSPGLEATTRGAALKADLAARGVRVEPVSESELQALADTEHPQGVVAVVEPRRWSLADLRPGAGTVVLVLDAVQDPGNVGTMLRTAHALGAAGVVALKGTVDLTNPKVLRGSMGTSFRMPAVAASPEEFLAWAGEWGLEIWVAAADGEPPGRRAAAGGRPLALVLGNEGAGTGAALQQAAHRRIGIPLAPGVESLNVAVAAGILLYELTRAD
jgi:TrmH family RNA methyltransferase